MTPFERSAWLCVRIQGLGMWTFGSTPSTAISQLCTVKFLESLWIFVLSVWHKRCTDTLTIILWVFSIWVLLPIKVHQIWVPGLARWHALLETGNLGNLDSNFQIRIVLWEHCACCNTHTGSEDRSSQAWSPGAWHGTSQAIQTYPGGKCPHPQLRWDSKSQNCVR